MALSVATITFNVSDMLGVDFDTRRTKAWTSTNVANDTIIDTAANQIRMGDGKATIGTDGTGSFTVWVPGSGANPLSWQTYFHFDYVMPGSRERTTRTFGPFTLTGSADLADLEAEQAIPPNYQSAFLAQAQSYLGQQESLAGIDSTDSAMAYNTQNGPLTKAALSASTAQLNVWAKNPDNLVAGALTYASGLLASAVVEWPDGAPGVLTIDSRQTSTGAVTAYHVTRVVGGTTSTYTQPTITRDSSGAATLVPQITVA